MTLPLLHRSNYPVGDPSRPLGDASYLARSAARVHLDDLRLRRDRYAIMGEATEYPIEGSREDYRLDLSNLLPLAHRVAYTGLCAEHAVHRGVNVALARVATDLARLARERQGRPLRDDAAESVPTRLHDHVGMVSRDETRTQGHRELGEAALDVRLGVLPHPSVHEHAKLRHREERPQTQQRVTVLVRGVGDIGSAVAHRLFREGYAVVIHDERRPKPVLRISTPQPRALPGPVAAVAHPVLIPRIGERR